MDSSRDHTPPHSASGKVADGYVEETAHGVAEKGHVATDRYGNALLHFDAAAERKLRTKIDLMIVPTVALLYLFCFSECQHSTRLARGVLTAV